LLAASFIFLLAVAHYAGGVLGFNQGYHAAMLRRDSDAFATSLALVKLRNQDYAGVIDLLETRLDADLIQVDASKTSYRSPYNIFWLIFRRNPQIARGHLLASVAEYRTKHPSTSALPEIRQRIAKIVKESLRATDK
jgi:hypothetical protein